MADLIVTHAVSVEVATVWTSPSATRAVDALAVADLPDVASWVANLSADEHLGLHGRTLTQLLAGEPVEVLEAVEGWSRVRAPWQPAPPVEGGYRGWVRTAHLRPVRTEPTPPAARSCDRLAVTTATREHLGVRYLWGGTSPWGFDCSGLVHVAFRWAGHVVPRDAWAQAAAADPVPIGEEQPGDLYFFAVAPGQTVSHVGLVTGPGRMLHAPEGGVVEEGDLTPHRRRTLVTAGRFGAPR